MKKILIIDDDKAFRRKLEWTLLKSGYQVTEAPSGKSGMRLFNAIAPDVVVVEIFMPEKDGLEVIMELFDIGQAWKVIAITGMGPAYRKDALAIAEKMSVAATFTKPLDMDLLCSAVASITCVGITNKGMQAVV